MEFELNEAQKKIRDAARRFTDEEIIPVAAENDANEHYPIEILKKMAPLGFLGATVPIEYGGAGLDYISDAIIFEELGRGCFSVRTIVSVQVSLVESVILDYGTREQKEKYLPALCRAELLGCFALTEPDSGSDAASLKTAAEKDADGWVLNGSKNWIGNGGKADVAVVFARTGPPAPPGHGHKGISAFLVERGTKGFTSEDITGKLGIRSSNTARIFFKGCRIPGDALLGAEGSGFKMAMATLDNGRFGVAAGCVGLIQSCIEASVRYAQTRKQFGKPIGSFQLVQDKIARMVVDRDAARLLVYRAGRLKDKGVRNTIESSVAKYFASEAAVRAASDAVQIHGANGYSNEYPVERYLRDAKVATIYEGTSEMQKLIIGRHTLGINAFI